MGNQSSSSEDISDETRGVAEEISHQIDKDGSGGIDMDETLCWWDQNYPLINARAMFESIDTDKNGIIDFEEWMSFWNLVKKNGYSDKDIQTELRRIREKSSWNFIA